ncbi:MAG: SMC-Scp complex subunit ScpB [Clostridia bacterium]|nr:SMC-Scp complex subunit ScpB [Clostridia bacterium]
MNNENGTIEGKIEAILFVAGEAVRLDDLAKAIGCTIGELNKAIEALKSDYDYNQRGFAIKQFGKHVQLTTRALYAEDVVHMLQPVQKQSLSQTIMETLAVIAYKQPVTKAEIEQIRGVKCDYSVQALVNKNLIAEVGRKDTLGRPILYGTTDEFLSHFGISDLDELPPMPENPAQEKDEGEHPEIIA